ncbi:DUF4920 domain-containing protein [Wenzhouxiangella sediminis]|uniref:DUF4920 domain-containing protein n=1 Tax=Wenzhouxiangella sediminis TaxID=1792836 RepID=A0A3E1KCZ5_9GAMM|nr:DUF4920 domain-containing protein [Wenzhouxiangella sediminis]RFF32994.1 DUF4920 domain-containing protein [Wenzhouxiangella sediminis]
MNKTLTACALIGLLTTISVNASDWFGTAPETNADPTDVAVLMADPQSSLDQRLTVSGRMTDVCTNRGCWAVFENDGEMLRIVARDHGFAIPADLRGPAIAHGVLERHEMSPETAEHMVTEDGADPGLLEDPVAYRLVADGVKVMP